MSALDELKHEVLLEEALKEAHRVLDSPTKTNSPFRMVGLRAFELQALVSAIESSKKGT